MVGVIVLCIPTLFGLEAPQEEAYSAFAIPTGDSISAKAMQFAFLVKRFATDDEMDKLARTLKEKGRDALRRELEQLNIGRIRPVHKVGDQIALARKCQYGPDTVITIVTAQQMPFTELYGSGRTVDYPFGLLQVTLNEKGEGSGQIMAAAKIRFDKKKGHYEIGSYGTLYARAINVRPMK